MKSTLHSIAIALLCAAPGFASTPQNSTLRWQVQDQGDGWLGTSVALGDEGAVLISGQEGLTPAVSIYSTASETPLQNHPFPHAKRVRVDAARHAQTLAAIVTQSDPATINTFWAELHVWQTATVAPADWVARFPVSGAFTPDGMGVRVSDDGERIVAWFTDLNFQGTDDRVFLRVFDRTGQLTQDLDQPVFALTSGEAALSHDGSRLLINLSEKPQLFNLDTGQVLATWPSHSVWSGLALSGDGKTVAVGDIQQLDVYRDLPGQGFQNVYSQTLASNRLVGPIALDSDGSHLAYSVQRLQGPDAAQIRVRDVTQDVEVYRHVLEAPGNRVSLWLSGLQMTEDAEVLAAASYGDEFDLTPTGLVLDSTGQPTSTIFTAGSALALDLDPSGQVFALGTIDTHFNFIAGGGEFLCADTRTPELRVIGKPHLGAALDVTVQGAGTHAQIGVSSRLGAWTTPYGVAQLDPLALLVVTPSLPLSGGGLQEQVTIPDQAALAGTPLHVQAALVDATTGAGYLSNRVSLRALP